MKRRASPNQQAAGVSLFPFLAVLLCTMGALIVVLVVIARHARMQVAEAARRAAATASDGELAIKRGELEWRIAELKESRKNTQKLLTDKQLELSHIEEHARRLRDQLEESAAAREHLSEMASGDARQNEDLKKRLSKLGMDAERIKAEIDRLRKSGGGSGESYAIIPYHGPSETRRRPIYIECRKDGVFLQPEGIALPEGDFMVDLGPSNPLVSALRAAREYHLRNQFAGRGEAGTPYPLFIIRPDGITMSYAARAAIASWGPEFGYELVGQDWEFEFPPADPMLTLAMRQAVSEGRRAQTYLARAAPRLSHSGSHATFRAGQNGGLVQVDGDPVGTGRRGQRRPGWMPGRRAGRGPQAGGGLQPGGGSPGGLLASTPGAAGAGTPIHSIDGQDNPYVSALAPGSQGSRGGAGGNGFGDGSAGPAPADGRYGMANGPGGLGTAQGNRPGASEPGLAGSGAGQPGARATASGANGVRGGSNGPAASPSGAKVASSAGAGTAGGPIHSIDGQDNPYVSALGSGSQGTGTGGSGTGLGGGSTGTGRYGPANGGSQASGAAQGSGPWAGGTNVVGTGAGQAGSRGTESGGNGAPGGSNGPAALPPGNPLAMGPGGVVLGGYPNGDPRNGMGMGTGNAPNGAPPANANGGSSVNDAQRGAGPQLNAPQGSAIAGNGVGNAGGPGYAPGRPPGNLPRRGNLANGTANRRQAGTGQDASATGPAGPGMSDIAGNDAGSPATTGGQNVAAGPNGFAGATVVDQGGAASQADGAATRSGSAGGPADSGLQTGSTNSVAQSTGSVGRGTGGGNASTPSRAGSSAQANGGSSGNSGPSSSALSSQASSFGGSGGSSMQSVQMGGMPSPLQNLNFGQQDQQSASQSVAKQRGEKNWANPEASTSNVPIERPIRIVCDAEHLTLLPEGRGKQAMRVIPFKPRTRDSVDDLVASVWDRIDSWGTAGRGMYWRPTLIMEVEPGGQRRYAELQSLLADSGFDVHGKPHRRLFGDPRRIGQSQRRTTN